MECKAAHVRCFPPPQKIQSYLHSLRVGMETHPPLPPYESIDSKELAARLQNPNWVEKTMQELKEAFSEPTELLRSTIMSSNHENEEFDIAEDQLQLIKHDVSMVRTQGRGMDNFITSNSFCKNRALFQGWWNEDDQSIIWLARFGPGALGPPGGTHGGALAAVLDQFAGFNAVPVAWCVTGELKITYKSLVPLEEVVYVASRISKIEGRRIYVSMSIHALPVLTSKPEEIQAALSSGASVRKLKEPVNGHTHYFIPPPKTLGEALMIKIPAYKGGKKMDSLPPGFTKAWTLGLPLPAKL